MFHVTGEKVKCKKGFSNHMQENENFEELPDIDIILGHDNHNLFETLPIAKSFVLAKEKKCLTHVL